MACNAPAMSTESNGLQLDAEGVDALVDRLYVSGWNGALARVEREVRTLDDNARRISKADVLTILLNLTRPPIGPLARVEEEHDGQGR